MQLFLVCIRSHIFVMCCHLCHEAILRTFECWLGGRGGGGVGGGRGEGGGAGGEGLCIHLGGFPVCDNLGISWVGLWEFTVGCADCAGININRRTGISLVSRPLPFCVLWFVFSIIHRSRRVQKTGKAWSDVSRSTYQSSNPIGQYIIQIYMCMHHYPNNTLN